MKYQDICGVLENIDFCGWLSATEWVSKIRSSIESNEVWIENPFLLIFSLRTFLARKSDGNGTAHFNYLNTNIYSYLVTSGGQSSNLYLKVIHFFNAGVN